MLVEAATAALIGSLDDHEPEVRCAAVYALGSIAASKNPSGIIDPQCLVNSLTAMLRDTDATVRASTIATLGVAGPAAAPDPPAALLAALGDESSFNRAASVRALARFQKGLDERLIPTLFGLLENEQPESPVRAAWRRGLAPDRLPACYRRGRPRLVRRTREPGPPGTLGGRHPTQTARARFRPRSPAIDRSTLGAVESAIDRIGIQAGSIREL